MRICAFIQICDMYVTMWYSCDNALLESWMSPGFHGYFKFREYQSINQSINQSNNQSTSQSISQSIICVLDCGLLNNPQMTHLMNYRSNNWKFEEQVWKCVWTVQTAMISLQSLYYEPWKHCCSCFILVWKRPVCKQNQSIFMFARMTGRSTMAMTTPSLTAASAVQIVATGLGQRWRETR